MVFFLFILVTATHYHRPQSEFHHQNSLTDTVVHDIENTHSPDCRASSVQSLQTMVSSRPPSTSISLPRSEKHLTRQLSSPISPFPSNTTLSFSSSPHKNVPIYPSLHRIDNLRPRPMSFSKTHTKDENLPFLTDKPLDEYVISTNLPKKTTTTTLSENNENENSLTETGRIEIRVRCIFSRVGEIDTLNERYTAEIFFEASWYDDDRKIGSKYDPQMGHFNPQLVVLNHIGDSLRHEVKKKYLFN